MPRKQSPSSRDAAGAGSVRVYDLGTQKSVGDTQTCRLGIGWILSRPGVDARFRLLRPGTPFINIRGLCRSRFPGFSGLEPVPILRANSEKEIFTWMDEFMLRWSGIARRPAKKLNNGSG